MRRQRRAAAAGDKELVRNHVLPGRLQNGHEGRVAGLGIDVGSAGVKVGGADGVADDVSLLFQGDAVLVVVVTVFNQIAHRQELDCEIEIFRFVGCST